LDISHGMRFLHDKGLIHGELKPENVLVDKNNTCKLCNFELVRITNETLTVGMIGAWQYMAPEIMNESTKHNEKSDFYSFGIMMHEIFGLSKPYGKPSSKSVNQFAIVLQILNGLRPDIPAELFFDEETEEITSRITEYFYKGNELPNSFKKSNSDIMVKTNFDLCVCCWAKHSSERPTFDEIIAKLKALENLLMGRDSEETYH
jgi:serine/threonine protein kinase